MTTDYSLERIQVQVLCSFREIVFLVTKFPDIFEQVPKQSFVTCVDKANASYWSFGNDQNWKQQQTTMNIYERVMFFVLSGRNDTHKREKC